MKNEDPRRIYRAYLKELSTFQNERVSFLYPFDDDGTAKFLAEDGGGELYAAAAGSPRELAHEKEEKRYFRRIPLTEQGNE